MNSHIQFHKECSYILSKLIHKTILCKRNYQSHVIDEDIANSYYYYWVLTLY